MPCQFLDALCIVVLNELLALVLIVVQHDLLQQSVWECQLTYLVLKILANINEELIVAVIYELCRKSLCDLLTECLLVLNLVLTINAVKQFLVDF